MPIANEWHLSHQLFVYFSSIFRLPFSWICFHFLQTFVCRQWTLFLGIEFSRPDLFISSFNGNDIQTSSFGGLRNYNSLQLSVFPERAEKIMHMEYLPEICDQIVYTIPMCIIFIFFCNTVLENMVFLSIALI